MDRRDFIKISGAAAIGTGIAACGPKDASRSSQAVTVSESEGPEQMPVRKCGDDEVSLLGYGCMRWQMKKDADGRDVIDQQSVDELVDYAMAHGVNYYDTSPVYLQGQSEEATARALLRYPRDSYFIATKASNFSDSSFDNSVKMYRRSLEIFQTDHIDYYLLHSISGMEAFRKRFEDSGLMDFFLKEREAGRIRRLGFSFHGPNSGLAELLTLHERYHWDFVQIQMNYVDWNYASGRNENASEMYRMLDEKQIPIVIMEPLLGGQLSDVPDVIETKLRERAPSKSIASWAFRFCGSYPRVLTVLSGMTYMEHLQDNLDTYLHFKPLSEAESALLEEQAAVIRCFPLVKCTGCQYCMPCPYGIDIPGVFRHYNKCINEGLSPDVTAPETQENFKKLRRRYITSYNASVDSVRQADHCISCGRCTSACPQRIRIPNELRRIARYVDDLKKADI